MSTIPEIDQQIKDLEAQKTAMLKQAKYDALAKVRVALDELNASGYNYKLTDATTAPTQRRTGVRAEVLSFIKSAPLGLTKADILNGLKATDTKAKQSISNALAALKKSGAITSNDGVYRGA